MELYKTKIETEIKKFEEDKNEQQSMAEDKLKEV